MLLYKIGVVLFGMGFIGKSNFFVYERFGLCVCFGIIFIIYELENEIKNNIIELKCGDCNFCVVSCFV